MRKAFSFAVLVLALGCPVFAGEIHNPPPSTIQEPTTSGEIQNDVTYSLTQAVLDLLAALF